MARALTEPFEDENSRIWIANRFRLTNAIKTWLQGHNLDPLLFLEVAEFCRFPKHELAEAVLSARTYLRERDLPQANQWAEAELRRLQLTRSISGTPETASKFFGVVPPQQQLPATLPLVHSTDAYRFQQILETNILLPSADPILQKRVVYTSYGKVSTTRGADN